jgi:hypothetical protein
MGRDVAATRVGHTWVAQVATLGLIATAYDHYHSCPALLQRILSDEGIRLTLMGHLPPEVVCDLRVNGVDAIPLVEAEINGRFPGGCCT